MKLPRGHKCHGTCGHYRHGGKIYHHAGHHHRDGCGHHFVGGVWTLRDYPLTRRDGLRPRRQAPAAGSAARRVKD